MSRILSFLLALSAAALACCFTGCVEPSLADPARTGPFFAPSNFVGESSLGGIRRVVLLPVWGGSLAPNESAAQLDPVFAAALQQQNRFEVVTFSREECLRRFHAEALSSASALPHDFLSALRTEFAADAVIFVDLTVYEPYRPLALGLRAKLASLDGSRLIWTFDTVFSADNPQVANAARHFFLKSDRSGVPADLTPAVLQSPTRFAAYVATAMFETLPPVTPAPVVAETSTATEPTR